MCDVLTTFNPPVTAAQFQQLSQLYQLQNLVVRMQKNLALINSPVNSKELPVSNTTLEQVAASEYNDARLWTFLADANDMQDPDITEGRILLIPPKPPNNVIFGTNT